MDLNTILQNLNNVKEVKVLRNIITLPSKNEDFEKVKPLVSKLEDLLRKNDIIGKDSILLASQALFSLYANFNRKHLSDTLISLLETQQNSNDAECLKLTVTFGYLQLKESSNPNEILIYTSDICKLLFNIIQPHCISYTKYSYFAHKVLYQWLVSTSRTNFWKNDVKDVESLLEEILFSNWQNSIQDIAKSNSSKTFSLYLKIMNEKYPGYLKFVLQKCIQCISWNHVIKYKILVEVCSLINDKCNFENDIKREILDQLLSKVLENHLQKAASNVFVVMLMRDFFDVEDVMESICKAVIKWSEEKNDENVYLIYKYILQKVIKHSKASNRILMIKEEAVPENLLYQIYIRSLNNNSILLQLNKNCQIGSLKTDYQKAAYLSLIVNCKTTEKCILNFVFSAISIWANTESLYLRNEMIRNLDILFNRIHKSSDDQLNSLMLSSLKKLLDYCLGMASTYQRKILGLTIYRNILRSTNGMLAFGHSHNCLTNKTHEMLNIENNENRKNEENNMRNRLFKLVLDPANDIRTMAADLLIAYYISKPLTSSEIQLIQEEAQKRSNSLNFYEAETAAILIKLLYKWRVMDCDLNYWISEARHQLNYIKRDIYLATCNNKPFYGILIIILENLQIRIETLNVNVDNCSQLLNLLEEAVKYFTETLLVSIQSSEYESTVAGIGVVIQETVPTCNSDCDDLNIKPEHRNIFTCIWRSLKAACEISAELAIKSTTDDIQKRSCNIILNVLLKCYHKGAIKSAGFSLNRVCRYFCETNQTNPIISILENQIKTLCNLVKSNDEEAGLTIAFHRIVSGDVRPNKPFLHYAAETLLSFLKNCLKHMNLGSDVESPLPCVLQLNFLQTLIEDSQLLSSIIIYLEDACLICLEYMKAKDFLIRNAGMQLYGAIIPRLTGQISSVENTFGYGYSVSHFVIHYPRLSAHVLTTLESISAISQSGTINLEMYSNVSNILLLLSKLFIGGSEFIDFMIEDFINRVRTSLQSFLKSHIAFVRMLAAKVYVALIGRSKIVDEFVNLANRISTLNNENELHGFLLSFTYLKAKINLEYKPMSQQFSQTQLLRFWCRRSLWLKRMKQPCFLVETLLLKNPEIFYILGYLQNIDMQPLTTNELKLLIFPTELSVLPAFHDFVKELVNQYCKYDQNWTNVEFIETLLTDSNPVYGVSFFEFAKVDNLKTVVDKINHMLRSIYVHKCKDFADTKYPWMKSSLFKVLHSEVVKSIASHRLFDRHHQIDSSNAGIPFSENDINQLSECSVTLKLYYTKLHKFFTFSYNGYFELSDVEKKFYAHFILCGYKVNQDNIDFYPYVLLIARDDVPEVRDTFADEIEESIYCEFKGFCSKMQYSIMQSLDKNVITTKEYLSKCQLLLNLVRIKIYEEDNSCNNYITWYHDDVYLLNFINNLLDIKTKLLRNSTDDHGIVNYAIQSCNFENTEYFHSLKSVFDTPDVNFIIEIYKYVSNKLTETQKRSLDV